MKNKLMPLTLGFALLLGGAGSVSAALIDRGNGLIYDDDLDITWMADANYAATQYTNSNGLEGDLDGRMAWSVANTWAADLVFGGYDDWRLFNADPICGFGFNCTRNELGHLFYDELGVTVGSSINTSTATGLALFDNVQSSSYWSGTEYADTSYAWYFSTNFGYQDFSIKPLELYAWAVRSGDVAAASVPEPGTMLLLAAGMIGIVGVKRRRC